MADTTSSNKVSRRSSRSHHHPINPFSRRDRDHFPAIDDFLAPTSDNNTTIGQQDDHRRTQPTIGPCHSFPSDVDDDYGESSIFSMSIGARAALAEHMRHISKHGIDGEATNRPATKPTTLLDLQWEQFLEGNGPSAVEASPSQDADISRESSSVATTTTTSPWRVDIHAPPASVFEQSIEVMTDVSMDFFNSPRVKQLATPERNHGRTMFLSTRNEGHLDDDEDDDDDDDSNHSISMESTDQMAPELLLMMHHISTSSSPVEDTDYPPDVHTSFQSTSFCAPNLSRISSADDSEHPPTTMFGPMSRREQTLRFLKDASSETDIYDTHILSLDVSASILNVQSTHAPPHSAARHPRRNFSLRQPATGNAPSPLRAEASFHHNARPMERSQFMSLRRYSHHHDKENTINMLAQQESTISTPRFRRKHPRRNSSSTISPLTNPQSAAMSTLHALETMPNDLMAAIVIANSEPGSEGGTLSPISRVGSHVSSGGGGGRPTNAAGEMSLLSSHGGYRSEQARARTMVPPHDDLPSMNSSSRQEDSSISGSSSSSLLTGRKRYRTVIPRRVYLDSPSQFVVEQDSFGHISSTSDARYHASGSDQDGDHTPRSLLDSFEATILDGEMRPS